MAEHHRMFVDGAWIEAADGGTFAVSDPATGEVIGSVADGGPAEAVRAVEAAHRAFPAWAAMPARERAPILHRIQSLMETHREDLALQVTRENGKPLAGIGDAAHGHPPGPARGRGGAAEGYAPTVLLGARDDMRVCQEEIFGPVAPVLTFRTEAEVVERANATRFGLAAYVYTRDLGRATRVAEALEYGLVGLNDAAGYTHEVPFGGFKESGLGREGGREGLEEYLETKSVVVGLPPAR